MLFLVIISAISLVSTLLQRRRYLQFKPKIKLLLQTQEALQREISIKCQEAAILEEKLTNATNELTSQNKKNIHLQEDNNLLQNFKGRYEQIELEKHYLIIEKEKIVANLEESANKLLEFEKKSSLLENNLQNLENEKLSWSRDKEILLKDLSQEIMKKNYEQQEKFASTQQEEVKKITENLFKNFDLVLSKMSNLDQEVRESSNLVKALSSPRGAGSAAEITLENILKNSGLKEKENLHSHGDYILQQHFSSNAENSSRRPDAILFLPNNTIAIIDSKASSHFIDLFLAKQCGEKSIIKDLTTKLKQSMQKHVEDLKKRDYENFFLSEMNLSNMQGYSVMNIMFLQTEQMLEIVIESDNNFFQKTMESGIYIATPITLINLLNSAKFSINQARQNKNFLELKIEISKLLDSIIDISVHSKKIGSSLNTSLKTFNEMTKSFNAKIIPSMKNINEMGIVSKKSNEVKLLENYETNL